MKSLLSTLMMCVVALGLLAGCQRDNHPRLPESSSRQVSPTVGPASIATNGGHAQSLTGRSGGDGGSIAVSVSGGHLLRDDGRVAPTPATNLLTTNETDDGVVTYAELDALSAAAVAGGVATFSLGGDGFWLDSDIELDLSDAPYTGTTPATDVLFVQINSDEMIRIDGDVTGTREGNEAVGVGFESTHTDGLVFRGIIDTRGDTGFDGGDVGLVSTDGDLVALGAVHASGGNADAANDAGAGGNVTLDATGGDLLLRDGALNSTGGLGRLNGGNGGNVFVSGTDSATISFRWGIEANGGSATDGDAGNAGSVQIFGGASTSFFSAVRASGGTSVDGAGGDGGDVEINSFAVQGTLQVYSHGGTSVGGDGGDGNHFELTANTVSGLHVEAYANGGRGDAGGNAGEARISSLGLVSNTDLWVEARGGAGTNGGGGDGGGAFIVGEDGSVTVVNTIIAGQLWGGNTDTGTGGGGGDAFIFNNNASTMSVLGCAVDAVVDGGAGDTGGDGGEVVVSVDGTVTAALYGSSHGGESFSDSGGAAGIFVVEGNDVDVWVQGSANGGVSTGGTGGAGGLLVVDAGNLGVGGSAWLEGIFAANGGASDDIGGAGGDVVLASGDTGTGTIWHGVLSVNGGAGDTAGGAGGSVICDGTASLNIESVEVAADGGDSAAGDGGAGGELLFLTDEGDVSVGGNLRAGGGNGVTSGGDGGVFIVSTDDDVAGDSGDINVSGVVALDGGNATTGTGGDGGLSVQDATAAGQGGSILLGATIHADGGDGPAGGGVGGDAILDATTGGIAVNGRIFVRGGTDSDGGAAEIGFDQAALVTLGPTCIINADGDGTGLAGLIVLDPTGSGPNNLNLIESASATLSTDDGDGTDQSASNITRD